MGHAGYICKAMPRGQLGEQFTVQAKFDAPTGEAAASAVFADGSAGATPRRARAMGGITSVDLGKVS